MLQFKQDDTEAVLILTLTELVTIEVPYYLFVFTHVTTKETVKFIKSEADDESSFTLRYNQFTIDPSVVFENKTIGEWHYSVYEQASSSNTDVTLTGGLLETGKMYLNRATDFSFTKYNESQTFKVYNG